MSELHITISCDPIHTSDFVSQDNSGPRWLKKRKRGYIGPREFDKGHGVNNGSTHVGPSYAEEAESRIRFKKSYG